MPVPGGSKLRKGRVGRITLFTFDTDVAQREFNERRQFQPPFIESGLDAR